MSFLARAGMYAELEDYGCEDADECFGGQAINCAVLKIVELTIPSELFHLEYLLEYYLKTAVLPSGTQRRPAIFQADQMARRLCDILWGLRPKPEFYTVFEVDGACYVAIDRDTAEKAMLLFHQSILENIENAKFVDCSITLVVPKITLKYHKVDKLFIWKTGKLVKTYFSFKTHNNNIRSGPEGLKVFRGRLQSYCSVVCIDVEAFEWSQNLLLEIGLSEYFPAENRISTLHFIVKENEWRRNGSLVDDHRDDFQFGQSVIIEEDKLLLYLKTIFSSGSSLCIVGHNPDSDLKYLRGADGWFARLPHTLDVYDTQLLHKELTGRSQPANLQTVVEELFGKTPQSMHNAGNDAHYTLCAMLKMAGVDVSV